MSIRRRLFLRTAALALVTAGCAALWSRADGGAAAGFTVSGDAVLVSAETGAGAQPFTVSGTVTGLFPGSSAVLVVTVKNTMPFAIVVTQITVQVGNASTTCASSNLSVAGFVGSQQVPARSTGTVALPVAMSHAAGDGCQGAVFPLQYTATATKVQR